MKMNKTKELFTAASMARQQAYAPYSGFAVGAAVLGSNQKIYAGANVENISYPCGTCAEQAAIAAMVADGCTGISAVLVIADTKEPITPCGACLQRIKEFSGTQTTIHLANLEGIVRNLPFEEFLPLAFNNKEVKK